MTEPDSAQHAGSPQHAANTIRLSEERLTELLDELDGATGSASGIELRRGGRYSFRAKNVLAHLQQPGDPEASDFRVQIRNISATGISFLHGSFVHIGSHCRLRLVTLHGKSQDLKGQVVRCRYLEGLVHEIGVRFDQTIDPALFVAGAASCRALVVDDDPAIVRLAVFHLTRLNADVEYVGSGVEAIEKALASPYDMILLDIDMPEMDGIEVLTVLRAKGYSGLVVAFTSLLDPNDRIKYLKVGFDQHLGKPPTREVLSKLLETIREEPVHSRFHNDAAMAELIDAFVAEVPGAVRQLEVTALERNKRRLAQLAQSLMETAGGYGFDVITEAATTLRQACVCDDTIENIQPFVDRLVRLCRLARGPNRCVAPPP